MPAHLLRRTLLLAATTLSILAMLPGAAQALTVPAQSAAVCASTDSRTNWGPDNLVLPQFDARLGTLTAVTVDREISIQSNYSISSADNRPESIDFEVDGTVSLDVHGLALAAAHLAEKRSFPFTGSNVVTGVLGPEGAVLRDHPTNLAAWIGTGSVTSTAQAAATKIDRSSGNADVSIRTTARAKVCVTYSYTYEVLVCIGDLVWYDNDHDGIQDAGEGGVPGRPVTVTGPGGAVMGTTTSDANGRWKLCGLEPSTACVVSVDLPDGWNLTSPVLGTDRATDFDGRPDGADARFNCLTPPSGEDLTFDVGIMRNPPPTAPGPTPAALRMSKVANRTTINSGAVVKFTVRVVNRGGTAVRGLNVCDTPPTQLAFTSKPRGAHMRNGQLCWTAASLGAGRSVTYTYTMRAANVAARSCVINRVTASSATGSTASARDNVCVRAAKLGVLQLAG